MKETTSEHYILEDTFDDSKIVFEEDTGIVEEDGNNDDKMEILFVQENEKEVEQTTSSTSISKEDKFIREIYPQFNNRTKLELIDEILDLKRKNELLQAKVKTYEKTINKLL